ncbi:hypothetical protein A9K55_008148 [Cordyceps militaris]|uniref:Uncharacterized protein n=1 Tax=Cordyceps militaris TaxID=73501 RepID=A0A2H4SEH5_CORMI|nr:hypothetical protein A9K55_008148 [Cordyceps militaris]
MSWILTPWSRPPNMPPPLHSSIQCHDARMKHSARTPLEPTCIMRSEWAEVGLHNDDKDVSQVLPEKNPAYLKDEHGLCPRSIKPVVVPQVIMERWYSEVVQNS